MALSPALREYLSEPRFAVLATINSDGMPQQSVMWYELRGDTIVMNTTTTRVKGRNLARDRRISVCFADGYRYVTIAGEAELVAEQATAQEDIHRLAIRYHGEELAASMMAEMFSKQERVSIYLPIERAVVYGFE